MKKILLGAVFLTAGVFGSINAQIFKGNWMLGGNIMNLKFTNGFSASINPKAGYFIKNNWAVGAGAGLDIYKVNGSSATQTNWTIAPFTRYYFSSNEVESLLNNGRFFAEASAGFGGRNSGVGSSTNGVDLGIGAGYAYFITPNIGLEGLLKFNGLVGGGNTNFNGDLSLGVGLQIYIPNSKAKAVLKDKQ